MEKIAFWKNFNMGKELSIAGSYIYNGLKVFDEMETFYYEEEIFEFLYNTSVGLERLEKIAIVLQENITTADSDKFEATLITHNHMELIKRIDGSRNVLGSVHNAFIQLLTEFYKSWRYDRFSLNDFTNYDKEKIALIKFIESYKKIEITNEIFNVTVNDVSIKKFIGKTVGKIINFLYKKIEELAMHQNLYTYELRPNSKAWKIFLKKEYDFIHEDVLWKELLVYILNNPDNEYLELYKSLSPLDFDEADLVGMINSLKSDVLKQEYTDMLDALYEDINNKKERFDFLDMIGNESIILGYEENDDMIENDMEF